MAQMLRGPPFGTSNSESHKAHNINRHSVARFELFSDVFMMSLMFLKNLKGFKKVF